ncbi:PspC domain-containing protein [Schaalia suimastitidis]|uniref:PspC domain-containing protein n=1 Tax=Schaalia suimastitidis TaxID=121163 RepID=UPI0013F42658|nr:PspC domain-containing protein [Schaalia suimastitidis]
MEPQQMPQADTNAQDWRSQGGPTGGNTPDHATGAASAHGVQGVAEGVHAGQGLPRQEDPGHVPTVGGHTAHWHTHDGHVPGTWPSPTYGQQRPGTYTPAGTGPLYAASHPTAPFTSTPPAGTVPPAGFQPAGSVPPAGQPGASTHGYTHAPAHQPSPASQGFFASIRDSGLYRSHSRVVGGVCGGLGERFGWDPTLVRGITIVLAFFFVPLVLVYGVVWALLPEQSDGRIHLQELLQGRFDIAHLGQLILIVTGFGGTSTVLSLSFGQWPTWLFGGGFLLVVALTIALLASMTAAKSSPTPVSAHAFTPRGTTSPAPTTPASAPTSAPTSAAASTPVPTPASAPVTAAASVPVPTPTSVPATEPPSGTPPAPTPASTPTPAVTTSIPAPSTPRPNAAPPTAWQAHIPAPQTAPYRPQSAPPAPNPYVTSDGAPIRTAAPVVPVWRGPVQIAPKPRTVSGSANLALTGLIVLILAGCFALMRHFYQLMHTPTATFSSELAAQYFLQVPLIGGGICLVLVGFAIAIASIKDRGAGWLIALSIIGCLIAVPTTLASLPLSQMQSESSDGVLASQSLMTISQNATWENDHMRMSLYTDSANLMLEEAPQGTTKTITYDGGSIDSMVVTYRTGQPVRIVTTSIVNNFLNTSAQKLTRSTEVASNSGAETVVWESPQFSADKGITVVLNVQVHSLHALEVDDTGSPVEPTPESSVENN